MGKHLATNAFRLIELHESFKPKPYYCSQDKLTIGYGHNLEDNLSRAVVDHLLNNQLAKGPRSSQIALDKDNLHCVEVKLSRNLSDGITYDEAGYLLTLEVGKLKSHFSNYPYYSDLDVVRKAVVIDMAYNLGIAGFEKFKKTIAHLTDGDFLSASEEMMDSKWFFQVKTRSERLCTMMVTGEWPIE